LHLKRLYRETAIHGCRDELAVYLYPESIFTRPPPPIIQVG